MYSVHLQCRLMWSDTVDSQSMSMSEQSQSLQTSARTSAQAVQHSNTARHKTHTSAASSASAAAGVTALLVSSLSASRTTSWPLGVTSSFKFSPSSSEVPKVITRHRIHVYTAKSYREPPVLTFFPLFPCLSSLHLLLALASRPISLAHALLLVILVSSNGAGCRVRDIYRNVITLYT